MSWLAPCAWHQPRCLSGRANTVLVIDSFIPGDSGFDLICNREAPRQDERKTTERLRESINDHYEEKLLEHLSVRVIYRDMARYGMQHHLKMNNYLTLRVIVLKKLTSRVGQDFVKAWLEAVIFHAYLWNGGCEHGDPSLWNLMYDTEKNCGVLSDYDLSVFHEDPRVPGTDRTGTIPFMARELLTDRYWRGGITRVYRHELEAFIWILTFVFIRYNDGKAQSQTLANEWMTSNYKTCASNKARFQTDAPEEQERHCQPGYMDHWALASSLLNWSLRMIVDRNDGERPSDKGTPSILTNLDSVAGLWPAFIGKLENIAARNKSKLGYVAKFIEEFILDNRLAPTSIITCQPRRLGEADIAIQSNTAGIQVSTACGGGSTQ